MELPDFASVIRDLVSGLVGAQAAPPGGVVAVTGALALAGVLVDRAWRVTRNAVTIAHEGGHALAAVAARRRLDGIRLHSDTSGLTVSRGRPTGPGVVVTVAAGYITPSLLGLGYAALLAADYVMVSLWISVGLLAAMLVLIRNVYGVLAVVVTGALVVWAAWFAPPDARAGFAYLFAWFLLIGGTRPIVELQRKRRRRRAPSSDADQLAGLTGIPGLAWVALFGLVALGALIVGARLLLA